PAGRRGEGAARPPAHRRRDRRHFRGHRRWRALARSRLRERRQRRRRHERRHDWSWAPGGGPGDRREGALQPGRPGRSARSGGEGDRRVARPPEEGGGVVIPRLVIATKNRGKVTEMRALLEEAGIVSEVVEGLDWPDIDETGDTLEENALLKARAVCEATGLSEMVDDTGLEVDAIDFAQWVSTV